jgi:hypothetical protein
VSREVAILERKAGEGRRHGEGMENPPQEKKKGVWKTLFSGDHTPGRRQHSGTALSGLEGHFW